MDQAVGRAAGVEEIGKDKARRDGPGDVPVRPVPSGSSPSCVQQALPPGAAPVGRPESAILPVGRGVLQTEAQTGQEPCLRGSVSGPALAEDSVADVAGRKGIRGAIPLAQSAASRIVGAVHDGLARRFRVDVRSTAWTRSQPVEKKRKSPLRAQRTSAVHGRLQRPPSSNE